MKTFSLNEKSVDLAGIIEETKKIGDTLKLTNVQRLQLNMVAEETLEMVKEIVTQYAGELWFDIVEGGVVVNIEAISKDMDADTRDRLVSLSSTGTNAAYRGFKGMILSLFDNEYKKNYSKEDLEDIYQEFYLHPDKDDQGSIYVWNNNPDKDKKSFTVVDETERSILANVADKIEVGVINKKATIKVYKKF